MGKIKVRGVFPLFTLVNMYFIHFRAYFSNEGLPTSQNSEGFIFCPKVLKPIFSHKGTIMSIYTQIYALPAELYLISLYIYTFGLLRY